LGAFNKSSALLATGEGVVDTELGEVLEVVAEVLEAAGDPGSAALGKGEVAIV
jgi:hypothetical protein